MVSVKDYELNELREHKFNLRGVCVGSRVGGGCYGFYGEKNCQQIR